ncbi:MAG: nucleotide exchange factor GrpE [Acidimicrobiales bacterium]
MSEPRLDDDVIAQAGAGAHHDRAGGVAGAHHDRAGGVAGAPHDRAGGVAGAHHDRAGARARAHRDLDDGDVDDGDVDGRDVDGRDVDGRDVDDGDVDDGDVDGRDVDGREVGESAFDDEAGAGELGGFGDDPTGDEALAPAEAGERARLVAERDEYLETLRRLQADFENYKKRMIRQQTAVIERAAESLVEKLLPVLDTADLALSHGGGLDAVVQLRSALGDTLAREGLERIEPVDEAFDPNEADAVAHEPGEDDAMTVVEVLRAGYRWKGRVLRPAMVKVRG